AERHLRHQPVLLVGNGHERDPVVATEDGRLTIRAALPTPWHPRRPLRSLVAYVAGLPRLLRRLMPLMRKFQVDTVNVHFPQLDALTWILIGRLLGGRFSVVLSFHGLDLKPAVAARGIARFAWKMLLAGAQHIVVCSEDVRRKLVGAFPETLT